MSVELASSGHVPAFRQHHRMALALEQVDMSVQEMAEFLGVNRNTVGRWLNGHIQPSRAVLMVWADATGVPLMWLEKGLAPAVEPGPDEVCAARDSNPEPASYELAA